MHGNGHHRSPHHYHRGTSIVPQPRSLAIRILALCVLLLPPILYVISLSFTLKTIYSDDYSTSIEYASLGGNKGKDIGLRYHASPFYSCTVQQAKQIFNASDFSQICVRRPFLGSKGYKACLADNKAGPWPMVQYCQKSITTASLYTAGAIMCGLGLLVASTYAGLAFKDAFATTTATSPADEPLMTEDETEVAKEDQTAELAQPVSTSNSVLLSILIPVLLSLSTLLTLLAAVCLVAAQAVGISTFVSDRRPGPTETPTLYENRWEMGKPALVYTSVAWLSALLGVFVAIDGLGVQGRWRNR